MKVTRSTLHAIHQHLIETYPAEGCGFLLAVPAGTVGHEGEGPTIVRHLRVDNLRHVDRSAHNRYLISPGDYLRAEREARASALEVIGTYHSHPDAAARPSAYDLEHAWPWYGYLITSLIAGVVREDRLWQLAHDRSRFIERILQVKEN